MEQLHAQWNEEVALTKLSGGRLHCVHFYVMSNILQRPIIVFGEYLFRAIARHRKTGKLMSRDPETGMLFDIDPNTGHGVTHSPETGCRALNDIIG